LALGVAGCVPTISTIGGHDEAELRTWAEEAREHCLRRTGQAPPYPFTTDGCTLWPDGTWQSCCVEHDVLYWCGGSADARRVADEQFRACVSDHGGRALAPILYWSIRLGGNPWLPVYWRWGYGWAWPRGYTGTRE
jgi:hypothetical protein